MIVLYYCFLTSILLLRNPKPFLFLIYCMWPVCFIFPFPFFLCPHLKNLWKLLRLCFCSEILPWWVFSWVCVHSWCWVFDVCSFIMETSFSFGIFSWWELLITFHFSFSNFSYLCNGPSWLVFRFSIFSVFLSIEFFLVIYLISKSLCCWSLLLFMYCSSLIIIVTNFFLALRIY